MGPLGTPGPEAVCTSWKPAQQGPVPQGLEHTWPIVAPRRYMLAVNKLCDSRAEGCSCCFLCNVQGGNKMLVTLYYRDGQLS